MKEALEYIKEPNYRAVLVFPSHKDALAFMNDMFWPADAKLNRTEMKVTFPSGAELRLLAVSQEEDVYKVRGLEFQFLGFVGLHDVWIGQQLAPYCRSYDPRIPARVLGLYNDAA